MTIVTVEITTENNEHKTSVLKTSTSLPDKTLVEITVNELIKSAKNEIIGALKTQ